MEAAVRFASVMDFTSEYVVVVVFVSTKRLRELRHGCRYVTCCLPKVHCNIDQVPGCDNRPLATELENSFHRFHWN